MMRPLPLLFAALPAPVDVILLVCMSSPMYLTTVNHLRLCTMPSGYSRLKEAVAALELLMLVLDDLDTVDNLHESGLESFGLSVKMVSCVPKTDGLRG
jgi:hypothetical protein